MIIAGVNKFSILYTVFYTKLSLMLLAFIVCENLTMWGLEFNYMFLGRKSDLTKVTVSKIYCPHLL